MNTFQERLKDLLSDNGLSRLQLSKKINISSTTINDYFNKNYYPNIDIAVSMANFFNCSLDYLFGLSDEYTNNDKNDNEFFENMEYLIKSNNTSIHKTMKSLNMSEYNYFRWKGGKFPKTINLIEIAKYFDVSVDFLIGNKLS